MCILAQPRLFFILHLVFVSNFVESRRYFTIEICKNIVDNPVKGGEQMKNRSMTIKTETGISIDYKLTKTIQGYIFSIEDASHERYSTKPLPLNKAFARHLFRLLYLSCVTPITANDIIRDTFLELLY